MPDAVLKLSRTLAISSSVSSNGPFMKAKKAILCKLKIARGQLHYRIASTAELLHAVCDHNEYKINCITILDKRTMKRILFTLVPCMASLLSGTIINAQETMKNKTFAVADLSISKPQQ